MSISINFVDRNSDLDTLNKSYESLPVEQQQELEKALKKDGLVLVDVQVQGKHGVYTRKQWKKASDVKKNEGKSSKGAPDADKQNAVPQVIKGKHMSDLKDNLKEHGLVLDSIYSKDIQDDEEVVMYDKDKNTYTAKANVYSDGGVELRKITKEKKEETSTDNSKQQDNSNSYPDYVNKTKVGVPKAHSSSYFSEKKAIEFAKQLHDNGATNIEISSAIDGFNQTQYRVAWDKDEKKQSNTHIDSSKYMVYSGKAEKGGICTDSLAAISQQMKIHDIPVKWGNGKITNLDEVNSTLGKIAESWGITLNGGKLECDEKGRFKATNSDGVTKTIYTSKSDGTGFINSQNKADAFLRTRGQSFEYKDYKKMEKDLQNKPKDKVLAPKKDTNQPKPEPKSLAKSKPTAESKNAVKAASKKHDVSKVMEAAKKAGVEWKESDHAGINWMRCAMALSQHEAATPGFMEKTLGLK